MPPYHVCVCFGLSTPDLVLTSVLSCQAEAYPQWCNVHTKHTDPQHALSMVTKYKLSLRCSHFLLPVSHDTLTGKASLTVSGPHIFAVGIGCSHAVAIAEIIGADRTVVL